jgi:hypothetical protein
MLNACYIVLIYVLKVVNLSSKLLHLFVSTRINSINSPLKKKVVAEKLHSGHVLGITWQRQ